MKFKTAYGDHARVYTHIEGVSMTHQSHAQECDINRIMTKYEKHGILDHVNRFGPQYADFTFTPTDYQECMNAVLEADEMFSQLPAKVRKRFHNDAGAFIEFTSNPENRDEMVALGLSKPSQAVKKNSDDPTPTKGDKAPQAASKTPPEKTPDNPG